MIEINGVQKSFGDLKVLEDINLKIEDGDIYGLVGKSGAGKSTLLRCLNGLETYDSGSIKVNGIEVKELDKKGLRLFRKGRKVGFGTKRCVQQDGLRVLHGSQLPEECAQSGICSLAFFRAESLACGTARFALGLLCFTDRHQRTPRFI